MAFEDVFFQAFTGLEYVDPMHRQRRKRPRTTPFRKPWKAHERSLDGKGE